eukprot:275126-Chlamydomonas_euryale.AAC.2
MLLARECRKCRKCRKCCLLVNVANAVSAACAPMLPMLSASFLGCARARPQRRKCTATPCACTHARVFTCPHQAGDTYDRDEDHLALFVELLGKMPRRVFEKGKYAPNYFNRHGELRRIKKLKFWPIEEVLTEKYKMDSQE